MNVKANAAWQALLLAWESNTHYPHGHRYLKYEQSKDYDSKTKKNHLSINNNSENRNEGQLGHTLGWSFKKDFHSNKKD